MRKRILALIMTVIFIISGCGTADVENTQHVDEVAEDKWTITQHGPREVNMLFYTIHNPQKGLIVVDGGHIENSEYVYNTIAELGGKVDAWILTHPHKDHAGAFTYMYPYLEDWGIQVDKIYTVPMATPAECLAVASWDSVDTYNAFLALNIPDLIYLNTGDELEICGLKFEVLSAFDEDIAAISRDYLNDGSLMFKVYGETEEFLFCADVGKYMSEHIIENVGAEKLASDYIQMGHHGNGGLTQEFYELVSPKIAFFDAPDWLLYDQSGRYTTYQNMEFMMSLGCEIMSFNSAPNSIVLK